MHLPLSFDFSAASSLCDLPQAAGRASNNSPKLCLHTWSRCREGPGQEQGALHTRPGALRGSPGSAGASSRAFVPAGPGWVCVSWHTIPRLAGAELPEAPPGRDRGWECSELTHPSPAGAGQGELLLHPKGKRRGDLGWSLKPDLFCPFHYPRLLQT